MKAVMTLLALVCGGSVLAGTPDVANAQSKGNLAVLLKGDTLEVYVNGAKVHASKGNDLRSIPLALRAGDCIVFRANSPFAYRTLRFAFVGANDAASFVGTPAATVIRLLSDPNAPVPKQPFVGPAATSGRSDPRNTAWQDGKLPAGAEPIGLPKKHATYEIAFVVPAAQQPQVQAGAQGAPPRVTHGPRRATPPQVQAGGAQRAPPLDQAGAQQPPVARGGTKNADAPADAKTASDDREASLAASIKSINANQHEQPGRELPIPPATPTGRRLAEHANRLDLEIAALRSENKEMKVAVLQLCDAVGAISKPKPAGAMSRAAFAEAAYDKTPDDVVRALGKPARTRDYTDGTSTWYYENKTYDPANGKLDATVPVYWKDGRVDEIDFGS